MVRLLLLKPIGHLLISDQKKQRPQHAHENHQSIMGISPI